MSLTSSLDAASTNLLAVLTQLQLSNCRFVHAVSTGTANSLIFNNIPNVTSLDSDLVILGKMTTSNTSANVTANINQLGSIPVKWHDGSVIINGDVSSTRLFRVHNTGSGYELHILTGLSTADFTRIANYLGINGNDPVDPPTNTGPGSNVGQWVQQFVLTGTQTPPDFGLTPGTTTTSGSNLYNGTVPATIGGGLFGGISGYQLPINRTVIPPIAGYTTSQGPWAAVTGTLSGTWKLVSYTLLPGFGGWGYAFLLTWVRTA